MLKKRYTNLQVPPYPRVIGIRPIPTLRQSVGIARNYVGTGKRRAPKKIGGGNEWRKFKNTMKGVNQFLKQSKIISTVGAPLVQNLPANYQPAATALLSVAKKSGYGKRQKGGKITLKKVGQALKGVDRFLKKTKIISQVGKVLGKEVPAEYKPYSDAALKVASNLGYGKRVIDPLRARVGFGSRVLYKSAVPMTGTRKIFGKGIPYNRFVY